MRMRTLLGVLAFCLAAPTVAWADGVKLTAVQFPGSINGVSGTKVAPLNAPLSQRIVFEFSGSPEVGTGIAEALRIRVSTANSSGQMIGSIAFGDYKVQGNKIIFTPRLPTAPIDTFNPASDNATNSGLPGLLPGTTYQIDVTVDTANSIKNLSGVNVGVVPVSFTTTSTPSLYFDNISKKAVKPKKNKIKPSPGTSGIYPNPFSDPAGLFKKIKKNKRPPFVVQFDGPVSPADVNFTRGFLRLRIIETASGSPADEPLIGEMILTKNTSKSAEVLLYPRGVLPLGHTVALELSSKFFSITNAQLGPDEDEFFTTLGKYKVAKAPKVGGEIDEVIVENFDEASQQDTSIAADGLQVASWDAQNSNVLRASFGFGGDGSLGRFDPPTSESITIFLDTDFQAFPLFSGATPQAKPGTTVLGGVFNFTEFTLPANATLVVRGSNPLVLTATGDVLIEGKINLNGSDGASDDTFDSALTPMPGGAPGPGGGRGGASHPVTVPEGAQSISFIQTPQFGESGYAPGNLIPGGGGGGQCGCTLPFGTNFNGGNCSNYSGLGDGSRGSGGGGGSFNVFFPSSPEQTNVLISGRRGAIGIGNHLPIQFDPGKPIPAPNVGNPPVVYSGDTSKNAVAMPNPNLTFAAAHQAGLIYDTGSQFNLNTTWPQTKKITMFGGAGPAVFKDASAANNFIGPAGELQSLIGGQGGGGAGSRTEGLDQQCKQTIFINSKLPFTTLDSRGGGGGGGAGSMLLQALGTVEIRGPSAKIDAIGGNGGGGEGTGSSGRGGAGGGGSGGGVVIQSATNVIMNDLTLPSVVIDVSGGCGSNATNLSSSSATGTTPGGDANVIQVADGGPGGPGIVQIHIPTSAPVMVLKEKVNAKVFKSVFNVATGQGICGSGSNGQSNFNPLVNMNLTPTPLTPKSVARSTWYDLGSVTSDFRPLVMTSAGPLAGPVFGIPGDGPIFRGTNASTGFVLTNASGFVIDPFNNDIEVDSPDLLLADYIPNGTLHPNEQSVSVWFEGADEKATNPGSPDLTTSTGWVPDITLLNGKQYLRWEIRFDIATNTESPPQPTTPRMQVNKLRIPFKY